MQRICHRMNQKLSKLVKVSVARCKHTWKLADRTSPASVLIPMVVEQSVRIVLRTGVKCQATECVCWAKEKGGRGLVGGMCLACMGKR